MSDLLVILIILGWGSTKFAVALGIIFYNGFGFVESIILAMAGSMLGIVVFSYFGDALSKLKERYFPKKNKKPFKVNRWTRFLVRLRSGYGLAGIAFLTPLVLTVPVGAIMASSIYKSKLKVFTYMFFAFLFWSLLICSAYHFLNFDFYAMIQGLF